MSAHLSDAEIAEITKPLTQGAARIRFFLELGVKVAPRPNGQPLVWRADFEAARNRQQAANDGRAIVPVDWTRFDNKVRYGARGTKT